MYGNWFHFLSILACVTAVPPRAVKHWSTLIGQVAVNRAGFVGAESLICARQPQKPRGLLMIRTWRFLATGCRSCWFRLRISTASGEGRSADSFVRCCGEERHWQRRGGFQFRCCWNFPRVPKFWYEDNERRVELEIMYCDSNVDVVASGVRQV